MEKLTEEEFNKKYKEDAAFKSEVDNFIEKNKKDVENLSDEALEQASGGTWGVFNPYWYYEVYRGYKLDQELKEAKAPKTTDEYIDQMIENPGKRSY